MGKEEIKKLLDESKSLIDKECADSKQRVEDELALFKKKTLNRI
jgi:hypothetical protein